MKISVIRKDVPLPPPLNNSKYPVRGMDVGDCFILTPEDKETARLLARRVISTVSKYAKATEKRFTVRSLPDGTVGVWRKE